MIKAIHTTLYRLENMPYICHNPCGDKNYNELGDFMELDQLEYKIQCVIGNLDYAIKKYDYPKYQPEDQPMVNDLKRAKEYLETQLKELKEV